MKKLDATKLVVTGTEWISRMALLNLTWLLFSLPLVTLIPATDALFEVVHQWEEEGPSSSVFSLFVYFFKKNFKSSYKMGLFAMAVGLVFLVDIVFLEAQSVPAAWFHIFKYAVYTLFVVFVAAVLYGYPLSKRTLRDTPQMFLMGIMVAVGHPLNSLGLLASMIGLGFIFLRWPALFFFFSASGVAWLATKAVSSAAAKNEKTRSID